MVRLAKAIPEEVRDFFEYRDGQVIRIAAPHGRGVRTKGEGIGEPVGCISTKGYLKVKFRQQSIPVHRLAWFLVYGDIPDDMQIDHINGNKLDNRVENLRLATNGQNIAARSNGFGRSSTGVKNVSPVSGCINKWQVHVSSKYFGCYNDIELAELVAYEAREKLHGEFANHG